MKDQLIKTEHSIVGHDIISRSLETGMAIIDDGKKSWDSLVAYLKKDNGHIIALRGAGSVNGMDKGEIDSLLEKSLIPQIQKLLETGTKVTLMFDGDPDSFENPDIGYVAGRLLDYFGNNTDRLLFIAAQKRSWYYPGVENGNLANDHDSEYVTYVFDDEKYDGDHNAFTQDKALVSMDKYEQWYIGSSGDIATSQLEDFNEKVPVNQVRKATIFRVRSNARLDDGIRLRLEAAKDGSEAEKVKKFEKQLDQREHIYGTHWDNDGASTIDDEVFQNLAIETRVEDEDSKQERVQKKIDLIRSYPELWINQLFNLNHRFIRTEACKMIDFPAGASVKTFYSEQQVKAALAGYEDIWEVKNDGDRNEIRIVKK